MTSIKDLLGISLDMKAFNQVPDVPLNIERSINQATKRLQEVMMATRVKMLKEPPDASLLYWKFMRLMDSGEADRCREYFASAKQARKLSFLLTYREKNHPTIAESLHLKFALTLLQAHWRDRLLPGLLLATLQNWSLPQAQDLRQFLLNRLNALQSNRPRLLRLQSNQEYFASSKGTLKLALKLIEEQHPLSQVSAVLGLPDGFVDLNYFGDVCFAYTQAAMREKTWQQYLPAILDFLQSHRTATTAKKVLPLLILTIDKKGNNEDQDLIKKVAFNLIGDPDNDAYWHSWEGATARQAQDLSTAQGILNQWIIKQFIEIFFDSMDMNSDRKLFWRNYLKHIRRFKIYGQFETRRTFARDERIEPYLESRFGWLRDDDSQSALVMEIGDYYLTEFSFTNSAFYAYLKGGASSPNLDKDKLSIHSLKPENLRRTFVIRNHPSGYGYEYRVEGKLSHNGDWESRLQKWLREKVGV